VRSLSREARIKAAAVLLVIVAALAMFIWGQDKPDDRIVISNGPPPTITPIPPSPTLPQVILPAPTPSP